MTRVSKSHLNKPQLDEISMHFSQLIASLSKDTEIESFFEGFLTKEEKVMLAKRLVLFMLIKQGYSPSFIQTALHVSYETVRTYSIQLESKNSTFLTILDRLINAEKTKAFWKKIEAMVKPIELALRAKTDMKARAKFASGDWS